MNKNLVWLLVGIGVVWFISRKRSISTSTSAIGQPSGLGVGGRPRMGRPKTEAERLASHEARYNSAILPSRGTGVRRLGYV